MTNHPNRSKIKDWPEHLKAFRASHGLTQVKLADLLQVSKRAVEEWEAGNNNPAPYLKAALKDIAKKFPEIPIQ